MALRIRRIGLDDTPSAQLSLEALARVLRPTIVSEVIDRCAAREKRAPKLPASAVLLLLCLAMNLYSSECLTHVLFRLAGRMRWLLADPNALRVSKGALCQARYRLGARPLVELFRRVCKPLATPATPGAFLFGLRLMALDGTLIDAPDTPGNVRAFGKRRAPRGQSAWPQVRVVAMSECATHAVCEAGVWPHDFDERVAGGRLLPRGVKGRDAPFVGPGVPQLRDGSGRPGQRRPPSRAPATLKARLVRTLADGTKLVLIRRRRPPTPSEEERLRGERTLVMVRLVRYTLEDQIPSWPSAGASPDQLAARLRKRPRTGSGPRLPRSLGVRARRGRDENPPAPAPQGRYYAPRGPWASFQEVYPGLFTKPSFVDE